MKRFKKLFAVTTAMALTVGMFGAMPVMNAAAAVAAPTLKYDAVTGTGTEAGDLTIAPAATGKYLYIGQAKNGTVKTWDMFNIDTLKKGTATTAANTNPIINLESFGVKKDLELHTKTNDAESTDPEGVITISANPVKKFKVALSSVATDTYGISVTGATITDLEFKVGTNGSWNSFGGSSAVTADTFRGKWLSKLSAYGGTIYFRAAGTSSASASASATGTFPSAEVKLKVPKAPKAPKMKINLKTGTVTFPKGSSYTTTATSTPPSESKLAAAKEVTLSSLATTTSVQVLAYTEANDKKPASMYGSFNLAKAIATGATNAPTDTSVTLTAKPTKDTTPALDYTELKNNYAGDIYYGVGASEAAVTTWTLVKKGATVKIPAATAAVGTQISIKTATSYDKTTDTYTAPFYYTSANLKIPALQ